MDEVDDRCVQPRELYEVAVDEVGLLGEVGGREGGGGEGGGKGRAEWEGEEGAGAGQCQPDCPHLIGDQVWSGHS